MRRTVFWRRATLALGIFLATSGLIAACGGGSSEASDEGYVKAICESNDVLEEVIGAAIAAAFAGDEEPDTDEMASAFEKWLDALEDANPPSDMEQYHDALVDGVREAVDALKSGDGDFESIFDGIEEPEEPPQEILDRLNAAAETVSECEDMELFS